MNNWHKLSEMLPPIIKEDTYKDDGTFKIGDVITIRERRSKIVLFRSPSLKKFCKDEMVDATNYGYECDTLMGHISIEDIIEGQTGDPNEDHRVIVFFMGIDSGMSIEGTDDPKWFEKYFGSTNDIEWLDPEEL